MQLKLKHDRWDGCGSRCYSDVPEQNQKQLFFTSDAATSKEANVGKKSLMGKKADRQRGDLKKARWHGQDMLQDRKDRTTKMSN